MKIASVAVLLAASLLSHSAAAQPELLGLYSFLRTDRCAAALTVTPENVVTGTVDDPTNGQAVYSVSPTNQLAGYTGIGVIPSTVGYINFVPTSESGGAATAYGTTMYGGMLAVNGISGNMQGPNAFSFSNVAYSYTSVQPGTEAGSVMTVTIQNVTYQAVIAAIDYQHVQPIINTVNLVGITTDQITGSGNPNCITTFSLTNVYELVAGVVPPLPTPGIVRK